MMRPVRAMGLVVVVGLVMAGMVLSAPPAQAQALFGTTSFGPNTRGGETSVFYSIDPATGTATLIGPVGFFAVSGMAFHPTDRGVVRRGF